MKFLIQPSYKFPRIEWTNIIQMIDNYIVSTYMRILLVGILGWQHSEVCNLAVVTISMHGLKLTISMHGASLKSEILYLSFQCYVPERASVDGKSYNQQYAHSSDKFLYLSFH